MIILGVFSDPYKNVFIVDGKIKSLELKNYNGENNSGIVEQVDDETVIGLFIDNAVLYLLKNKDIFDVKISKISCTNKFVDNRRIFELKSYNSVIYRKEYNPLCSMEDLLMGELEEDHDFLLYLSNILSQNDRTKEFIQGHTLLNRERLSTYDVYIR